MLVSHWWTVSEEEEAEEEAEEAGSRPADEGPDALLRTNTEFGLQQNYSQNHLQLILFSFTGPVALPLYTEHHDVRF